MALLVHAATSVALGPSPRTAHLVASSVVAGAAPFVHGRLGLVPLIWLGVVLTWRRRLRPTTVAAAAAVTILTVVALSSLDSVVGGRLWTDAEPALAGGPGAWFSRSSFWSTLIVTTVGQLWYVVVSSVGLAVAGVVLLARMVVRPSRPGERAAGVSVLVLVGSNIAVSCVVMAGFLHTTGGQAGVTLSTPRWDHMIYGRYNDAAIVVLSAVGVLWCWRLVDRGRAVQLFGGAALASVLGAVVVGARMASLELDGSFPPNFAGLSALPVARTDPDLLAWTVAGVLVMALLGAAVRTGRRAVVVVVATWLVAGAVAGTTEAVRLHSYELAVDVAELLRPTEGATIEIASDAADHPALRMSVFATQYELLSNGWTTRFSRRDSISLAGATDDVDAVLLRTEVVPDDPEFVAVAAYDGVTAWERR
jgi:hypothetical protein